MLQTTEDMICQWGAKCQKSNRHENNIQNLSHKLTTCLGVIIGHRQLKRLSAIFIDTRTLTQPVIKVCFSRLGVASLSRKDFNLPVTKIINISLCCQNLKFIFGFVPQYDI